MQHTQQTLLDQLLTTAKALSTDKLSEALDFVEYLSQRQPNARKPERGSAASLLRHAGSFHFGVNEMAQWLADIARMRLLDLESHA